MKNELTAKRWFFTNSFPLFVFVISVCSGLVGTYVSREIAISILTSRVDALEESAVSKQTISDIKDRLVRIENLLICGRVDCK